VWRSSSDLLHWFDVVSVAFEKLSEPVHIELFKNAFPVT